jgi:hypothetical protein
MLTLAVFLMMSHQNFGSIFQPRQAEQWTTQTKTRGMKKRLPYHDLSDPQWRLDQSVLLPYELAGDLHDEEGFLQFMNDLWKHLGFHSFQSTIAYHKILFSLKDLVFQGGRAHIILAAKLNERLTVREAAEMTEISVYQLIRARSQLVDFDLKNIVLKDV